MSAAVLREVRLYGGLGAEFGRVFHLAVSTPAEAIRALRAQLPGFEKTLVGPDGRRAYHVFVGRLRHRRDLGEEQLLEPVGATEPIRIVPVVAGAARGGTLQAILGAVLIVVGLYFANSAIVQVGVSMLLGGVIQLLSPQRKNKDPTSQLPSYAFDGPINNAEQGGPVPLVFGRVICGSVVVSQGIATDQLIAPAAAAPAPPALPSYEPRDPANGGDVYVPPPGDGAW